MRCLALTAFLLFFEIGTLQGQSSSPPNPILQAQSTLVLAPALVKTKTGELVYTLNPNDFLLTDNTVEQKLTLEEDAAGQPLALVVVVETGGAGARQLDKLRKLGSMIENLAGNVPHEIAVVDVDRVTATRPAGSGSYGAEQLLGGSASVS